MNDEALKVRELFEDCLAEERSLRIPDLSPVKKRIFDKIIFEPPLFVTNPDAEMVDGSHAPSREERILHHLDLGSKHRDLLELLRKANDNPTRWLVLAWWLNKEGICEPAAFLPFSTMPLAKKCLSHISAADIHYASLVDIWRPYFEALMRDWKAFGGNKSKLKDKGYDSQAIISIHAKSVVRSICEWLEIREHKPKYNSGTLQNAYSRCQPTPRKKRRETPPMKA
jgi:hypothetical protein